MPDIAQLLTTASPAPLTSPADAPTIHPRRIGYARVSTDRQDESLQLDALTEHGVDAVYVDHGVSGAATSLAPARRRARGPARGRCVLVVYIA